jgi:type II secretory pathway component PulF
MDKETRTLQFMEMLLVLLEGNINLTDAVSILTDHGTEKSVRETAEKLMTILKKGRTFTEAMTVSFRGGLVFPDSYEGLVRAAEKTGAVNRAFVQITSDLKRKIKAREAIITALLYPAAIIFIALAGTVVLLLKGFPFFAEAGMLSKEYMPQAKNSILFAGVFLLVSGTASAFACYKLYAKESAPFRIFYELSFLLDGNISLPDALSSCIMCIGENKWGRALAQVKKDIISGARLAASFEKTGVFPAYITGWLAVGDRNGEIKTVCHNIAEYYMGKDEKRRATTARFLEPLFIVITGVYLLILIQGVIIPVLTRVGGSL